MIEILQSLIALIVHLRDQFPAASLAVVVYTTAPAVGWAATELIKLHRKSWGRAKLSRAALLSWASIISGVWAFRAAHTWFSRHFDDAITHAVLAGMLTPFCVMAAYRWLDERAPALAESMRSDGNRERDPFDDTNGHQ